MCRLKYESLPIINAFFGEIDEIFSDDEVEESYVESESAVEVEESFVESETNDEDDFSWPWTNSTFDSTLPSSATDNDDNCSFTIYEEDLNMSANAVENSWATSFEGDSENCTYEQITEESMTISEPPNSSCQYVENSVDVESFSMDEHGTEEANDDAVLNDQNTYFVCIECNELYNLWEMHHCYEHLLFSQLAEYLGTDFDASNVNCTTVSGSGLEDSTNYFSCVNVDNSVDVESLSMGTTNYFSEDIMDDNEDAHELSAAYDDLDV